MTRTTDQWSSRALDLRRARPRLLPTKPRASFTEPLELRERVLACAGHATHKMFIRTFQERRFGIFGHCGRLSGLCLRGTYRAHKAPVLMRA